MIRKEKITPGEYYHIFNRGNNKQNIFREEKDLARLLFLILYLQSPVVIYNISNIVSNFIRHRVFNNSKKTLKNILDNRTVELISFAQMPNHFHLIVKEIHEGGISQYLQRIQDAYTKYFNIKYGSSGHLFQGPFKAVRIKNNEQLLHLSAYIHRNPREIKQWYKKEHLYIWSSYQDYISDNRWGDLLKNDIIIRQFKTTNQYKDFVKTSGTKLLLDEKHFI
ncbi:transposase [Patescibacteria group bacterium]|nr:transposase [Patescibacteria group bacterium]